MASDPLGLFQQSEEQDPLGLFQQAAAAPEPEGELPDELLTAMGGDISGGGLANVGINILQAIPAGIRGVTQGVLANKTPKDLLMGLAPAPLKLYGMLEQHKKGEKSKPFFDMEEALLGMESSQEWMRKHYPRFRGERAEKTEQEVGEALQSVVELGGDVGERMVTHGIGPGPLGAGMSALMRPGPEGAPLARTLGEVATDLAPIPVVGKGAKMARRPAPKGEPVIGPEAVDAALYQQASEIAARNNRPVMEVLQEIQQGGMPENPLQLEFPDDVMRGRQQEAAMADAAAREQAARRAAQTELDTVAEQQAILNRELGQPDLFDRPITRAEEYPTSITATEAAPSLRSRERGPDIAELPTEKIPGRAAPKLAEQDLWGPREKAAPTPPDSLKYPAAEAPVARTAGEALASLSTIQALRSAASRNDYRLGLEIIRDAKDVPPYLTYLADLLLKDKDFQPVVKLVDTLNPADFDTLKGTAFLPQGFFTYTGGKTPTIALSGRAAGQAGKWLHEGVHAKAALVQHMYRTGNPALPRRAREAAQTIEGLWKYVQKHGDEKVLREYGMLNELEFLAEGFTNPQFQAMLKDLRYRPRPGEGFLRNVLTAWDAFVHSVARLLGLDNKQINVLSALLNEGAKIIREVDSNPGLKKLVYGEDAMKQASIMNASVLDRPVVNKAPKVKHKTKAEFLDELKAQGKPPEFLKRFGRFLYKDYVDKWKSEYGYPRPQIGYDNRPHAEFRQDLYNPDGQMRVDDIYHSWGTGYTESKRHPLLSRVYDQISQAENAINNTFDVLFRGKTIEPGKGVSALRFGRLKENPDSVSAIANKFTKDEINRFSEVVGDAIEAGRIKEVMANPEKFLPANEARMVRAVKKLGDDGFALINKARAEQGIEPLTYREDWFTSYVRHGKYHVFSLDEAGKSTYRKGFNDLKDAENLAAALRSRGFNNVTVRTAANDPRRTSLPPEAFFQARRLAETKEMKDALDKAIEELSLRMGTKKYGMARDSDAGGLPLSRMEREALGAQKTFDNFMFGLQAYASSVARYSGGHKYAQKVYDLFSDSKVMMDYPNAYNAAKARWEEFQGVTKSLDEWSREVAFGNQAFLQTAVISLNPAFYLANYLQFGFSPARMVVENARTLGGKGNVPLAMIKGLSQVYYQRTPETRAIIQEAVRSGSLEPRFAEALDWKLQEGTTLGNTVRGISLQKAGALSDSFSRMATYLMFYELGKSAGIKGSQLHSFAAKETQGVMVQYSRWARMPLFNKLGIVGDLISPVTSFISNLGFNVGQYMKTAVAGDKVAGRLVGPILAYMTAQVALSGIKGLPGYEDMDELMGYLNQMYVEKFGGQWFGTPGEMLNKLELNDYVVYGIPSASAGVNMTGTLGFGHVLPGFAKSALASVFGTDTQAGEARGAFPGVDYALKFMESVGKGAAGAASLSMSEQEKERIFSQIAPGAVKEWVKQGLSTGGIGGTLEGRAVGENRELIYQRDGVENVRAMIAGKQPIGESKERAKVRLARQKESSVNVAKGEAMQQLVDSIQRGGDMTSYTERVISNYPEIVDGLMDRVISELESRQVPFYERKLMEAVQGSGLSSARKLETLESIFRR